MAALNPYVASNRFKPFDGDTELLPGVRARAARGHTAGHTVYFIESQGQKMAFWGDLMHVAAVQFENPSITIQFDTDSRAAAAQRRKAYVEAASQGYLVAGAHISFPGIGRLRAQGNGYVWIPVNYAPGR
jgi:glyoxylase-like metal-dependent hydrolase (beta-lactamase superfamily II)